MALASTSWRRPAAGATAPAFLKRGRPEAIAREADVLAHVERLTVPGAALAPAVLSCDPHEGVLLVESLDDWSSLHRVFGDDERRDVLLAGALGTCLARLHRLTPGDLAPALEHVPRLELEPREAAELPGAMLELVALLQRMRGLESALEELRAASRGALVHGDVKLDNVLAEERDAGAVRLVDFEHAGAGDPAWDVGAAVGDYVSRWLLSLRASAAGGLSAWLDGATIPREHCAAAARSLLTGYQLERPLPDRDTVAACAGVFLIHRAQAWVERYGRLTAKPTLLARCGARIAVGGWRLLGPLLEGRP
jgi:aminoglycoside phosphotransferase (APT) family kinase protein